MHNQETDLDEEILVSVVLTHYHLDKVFFWSSWRWLVKDDVVHNSHEKGSEIQSFVQYFNNSWREYGIESHRDFWLDCHCEKSTFQFNSVEEGSLDVEEVVNSEMDLIELINIYIALRHHDFMVIQYLLSIELACQTGPRPSRHYLGRYQCPKMLRNRNRTMTSRVQIGEQRPNLIFISKTIKSFGFLQ